MSGQDLDSLERSGCFHRLAMTHVSLVGAIAAIEEVIYTGSPRSILAGWERGNY